MVQKVDIAIAEGVSRGPFVFLCSQSLSTAARHSFARLSGFSTKSYAGSVHTFKNTVLTKYNPRNQPANRDFYRVPLEKVTVFVSTRVTCCEEDAIQHSFLTSWYMNEYSVLNSPE